MKYFLFMLILNGTPGQEGFGIKKISLGDFSSMGECHVTLERMKTINRRDVGYMCTKIDDGVVKPTNIMD